MKKKILTMVTLAFMALFATFLLAAPVEAAEVTADGTCGDDLTWELTDSGTLTISGTGAMADYDLSQMAPWSQYASTLNTVVISDGVTSIGSYSFYRCESLNQLSIASSVITVGDYAFYYCDRLTRLTVPENMTAIGTYAFCCDNLVRIVFEGVVPPVIGDEAFDDVSAVAYYPNSEGWTADVRQNYGGRLTWVATETSVTVLASGTCGSNTTWKLLSTGTLLILGTGDMSNYTYSIAPWQSYRSSIKYVIIGDGVTSIANAAFCYCGGLTGFSIGKSVTKIGANAFYECVGLSDISIPSSVTTIGSYAFSSCTGLSEIIIPDNVTSIESYAFSGCTGLASVTLGDGMTYISSYMFSGCSGLTDITWGKNIITIGSCAFQNCTGLTTISIPNGVTTIGSSAFQSCTGIKDLKLPDSVTTINYHAFSSCSGLKNVVFGSGLTSIDGYAFLSCSSLTELCFPENLTTIGVEAFRSCTSLTSITMGENVATISSKAFYGCNNLNTVLFKGMMPPSIGSSAFYSAIATAYYPCSEFWSAWTFGNYGGTLTWQVVHDYEKGICTQCQAKIATVESAALTLGNQLLLNISVMPIDVAPEVCTLKITYGDDMAYTLITEFTEAETCINFQSILPAHRLLETLTLELVCDGEVVDSQQWTMDSYVASLRQEYADDEAMLALLDALCDYAAYAAYLASPDGTAPSAEAVEAVTQDALVAYEAVLTTNTAALKAVVSLYIDDACALRFKFDAAAWEGCTLYVDGVAVEVTEVGSQVVYEIADLIPQDWGTMHNVQVTDGEGAILLDMDYSVMSYAYARLNRDTEAQPGLNGLLKAMYLYYKAAEAYAA